MDGCCLEVSELREKLVDIWVRNTEVKVWNNELSWAARGGDTAALGTIIGWGCHGDLHGSPVQGYSVVLLKGLHSVAPPVINHISCAKGSPRPVNTSSCWLPRNQLHICSFAKTIIEFFTAVFAFYNCDYLASLFLEFWKGQFSCFVVEKFPKIARDLKNLGRMVIICGHCHCVATSNPRNMRTALGPIARSTVPQGPELCVQGPGDLIFDGVARRLYRYNARLSKLCHLTRASSKPKGRTGNGIPSSYGQNLILVKLTWL